MAILIGLLTFVIIVASTWWFGLWSNLITLINFFIAALFASSFYENFGSLIDTNAPTYVLFSDFVAIWLLFGITFMVLRGLTDFLTNTRMKFDLITEMVGRSLLSIWIAGAFVCFTMFTLHLAPLPPDSFQSSVTDRVMGIGPDRQWMAFIQSRSRGALAESQDSGLLPPYEYAYEHPDDEGQNLRVFDPGAEFIYQNMRRRKIISENAQLRANY